MAVARLGGLVFVLGLLLSGCVEPGSVADGAPWAARCVDPCPVQIAAGALWEPHVAVHPTDPEIILASSVDLDARATDGRLHHWPLLHRSIDGGLTWTTVRLQGGPGAEPGHPLGAFNNIEEPMLVFVPDGTLLWSLLAMTIVDASPAVATVSGMSLIVLRSTDGGVTFPDVIKVQEGAGQFVYGIGEGPRYVGLDAQDKQWMAVEPDGSVLMVWSRNHGGHAECGANVFGECTVLSFSVSSDGGANWSPPARVESGGLYSGAYPVVRADGGWVVSYRDTEARAVRVALSEDGGRTWVYQAFDKTSKFPVMAAVSGPSGERLVLVHPESEEGTDGLQRVVLRWSDDGGATWGSPVALDAAASEGRTTPAVAALADGSVVVTFWHPVAEGAELRAVALRGDGLSEPLVVDRTEGPTAETGDYMGLAPLPDGGAFAVWVSRHDGELALHGARLVVA